MYNFFGMKTSYHLHGKTIFLIIKISKMMKNTFGRNEVVLISSFRGKVPGILNLITKNCSFLFRLTSINSYMKNFFHRRLVANFMLPFTLYFDSQMSCESYTANN